MTNIDGSVIFVVHSDVGLPLSRFVSGNIKWILCQLTSVYFRVDLDPQLGALTEADGVSERELEQADLGVDLVTSADEGT